MSIKKGDNVEGVDINNSSIAGTVIETLQTFRIAIISTGDKKLDVGQACFEDIKRVE